MQFLRNSYLRSSLITYFFALIYAPSLFAAPPVVVSPYNDEVILIASSSTYPTVSGTADAGATVSVTKDDTPICSATTDTQGSWTCQSTIAFTPGKYALGATSSLGDMREVSATNSYVTIAHAIDTPVVVSPYNNEVITISEGSTYPTITGTATAGTSIVVKKDGLPICTTTTSSSGTWTCQSTLAFTPGTHGLMVTSTLGGQSKDSATVSCVIIAYVAPTHVEPTLNPLDNMTLTCGQSTTGNIYLTGTGSAGASITLVTGTGVVIASSVVDTSGSWWATSSYGFSSGSYTITVISTVGGTALTGTSRNFSVIGPNNCNTSHKTPTIAPVSDIILSCSESSRPVTFTGSGTVGATITLKNTSGGSIGSYTIGTGGTWTITPAIPYPLGTYSVYVESTIGNSTIIGSTLSFTITKASGCTCPSCGGGVSHLPPTITPIVNFTLNCSEGSRSLNFSGTGTVGSTVTLRYLSGSVLASTTVTSDGTWSVTPVTPFSASTYNIAIESLYRGATLSGAPITFTISSPVNCAPTHTIPSLNPIPEILLPCGQDTATSIAMSGSGSPGASITLSITGGIVIASATVDGDGSWKVVSNYTFSPGSYNIVTTSILGASRIAHIQRTLIINKSNNCTPVNIRVGLDPISDITLTCASTASVVNLSGSGTPGATVTVRNSSGTSLALATVDASGYWSSSTWSPLPVGTYTLIAYAESTSGGSGSSNAVTFTIRPTTNCGGPVNIAPTILPVGNSTLSCQFSSDGRTFSGSGTPGANITLRNASGAVIGGIPITVGSDGTWSYAYSPFYPGTHSVRVESTLSGTTTIGNTISFTVFPASNCGGPLNIAPVITVVPNLTLTCSESSRVVNFSGSGTIGSTVSLRNASGSLLATTTVGTGGLWSVTPSTAYIPGTHSVRVESTLSGTTTIGNTISFTVFPASNCGGPLNIAPVITVVPNLTLTCSESSRVVNFSGSGTIGSTVSLRNASGSLLATTTVGTGGLWSVTPSTAYIPGTHSVRVESTLSGTTTIGNTISFTVFPASNCGGPLNIAPVITVVPNLTLTCSESSRVVNFSGSGTIGSTVSLRNASGSLLATTTVGTGGLWSVTPSTAYIPGTHSVRVESTLSGTTTIGNTISFTVFPASNCGGPLNIAPVITVVPNLTLTCSESSRVVNFSGSGTIGSTVSLRNASGSLLATTTVGTGGLWSVTPSTAYIPGTHSVRVESTLSGTTTIGNTISFTVFPASNCGGPLNIAPVITVVPNLTLTCSESSRVVNFSGSGTIGSTVSLRNASGSLLATTTVGTGGLWSVTPSTAFAAGSYTIVPVATLDTTTLTGSSISFVVFAPSSCGGGGGGGGGGPSPTPIIYPTLPITPTPVVVPPVPVRPLTRYEIARTIERQSLTVRPYWSRFSEAKSPTKTFLGTGPKSLNERTHIVTNKRIQTQDETITKLSQAKKTFP